MDLSELLRKMQAVKAIVELTSDRLRTQKIVEQPSFPQRSDRSVEDRDIVWSLTSRLVDSDKGILDMEGIELKVTRLRGVPKIGGNEGVRVIPPHRSSVYRRQYL